MVAPCLFADEQHLVEHEHVAHLLVGGVVARNLQLAVLPAGQAVKECGKNSTQFLKKSPQGGQKVRVFLQHRISPRTSENRYNKKVGRFCIKAGLL